jgi:hypothetical protein
MGYGITLGDSESALYAIGTSVSTTTLTISRISAETGAVSWTHNLIYGAPNQNNLIARSWLGSASSFVFIAGYLANTYFIRIEITNGVFTKS